MAQAPGDMPPPPTGARPTPATLFSDPRVLLCMAAMIALFFFQQLAPAIIRRRIEAQDEALKRRQAEKAS